MFPKTKSRCVTSFQQGSDIPRSEVDSMKFSFTFSVWRPVNKKTDETYKEYSGRPLA